MDTTTLRIRIPEFTVDFSPDISPISFVDEDGQEQSGQEQGDQEQSGQEQSGQEQSGQEQDGQEQGGQDQSNDYYGDYEDNCTSHHKGNRKGHSKVFRKRKVLRELFHMKAPPSNVRNRVQKNGYASKMCSVS